MSGSLGPGAATSPGRRTALCRLLVPTLASLAGLGAASTLPGCAGPQPTALYPRLPLPATPGQLHDAVIAHGGLQRPIRYYLPANFEPDTRHPLILVLHGFNQPLDTLIGAYRSLQARADRDGTILIFPTATGRAELQTLAWNTGYGSLADTRFPETVQVEDVAYLSHLLDVFIGSFHGHTRRLYATGISLGGAMACALSLHLQQRLAAVAPVAMTMGPALADRFTQPAPMPAMFVTGTADPLLREAGIPGDPASFWLPVMSSADNLAWWKWRNRLRGEPEVTPLLDPVAEVVKGLPSPSHVVRHAWRATDASTGADLVWMQVVGGGHWLPTWSDGQVLDPANLNGVDRSALGPYNNDRDAAAAIYDFLLSHARA